MSNLLLAILFMSVLIEPVLSSTFVSNNVIDVRGGHGDRIAYKPFLTSPAIERDLIDPGLNPGLHNWP